MTKATAVPTMAHAIGRQDVMRCDRHCRTVAVRQHDVGRRAGSGQMGNPLEAIGQRVRPGQHRKHAGHGTRGFAINAADQRMGMRRAHRSAIGLAREIEIVAVAAAAGEEAQILLAAYRVSDACVHDGLDTRLNECRTVIVSQRRSRGYPLSARCRVRCRPLENFCANDEQYPPRCRTTLCRSRACIREA